MKHLPHTKGVLSMKLEYWSDIACPFCYIASHRMKRALTELHLEDRVPLIFHTFQLNPNEPTVPKESMTQHFASAFFLPKFAARMQMKRIEKMAEEEGLPMALADAKLVNTMDAHRLIQWAQAEEASKAAALIDRLYRAYFVDHVSVADPAVLQQAAVDAGLSAERAGHVLASDAYRDAAERDMQIAAEGGIQAAPFFVLNGTYGISGAQSFEFMVEALQKARDEEPPAPPQTSHPAICTPTGCRLA